MKLRQPESGRPSMPTARRRAAVLASISGLALAAACASHASAQTASTQTTSQTAPGPAAPSTSPTGSVGEVVVTASRVMRNGYNAPTPTTVVSNVDIQRAGVAMVFDYVSTLPEFASNATTATYGVTQSTAANGLSSLNLRGLGTNRTLTLLDGQRVVGALTTGVVDDAALPQALVKRVDVVTGGASASWGSDAVAGVVNYVIDHNFNGFKGEVSGGETNYNDDQQFDVALTAGTPFADGRGHFEVSGEFNNNNGVPKGDDGRTWDNQTKILEQSIAATPAGSPEYIVAPNVYDFQMAPGGIITSGPLKNIAFGPGGKPYNFQIGSPVAAPYSSGGTVSNLASNANLDAPLQRKTVYVRLSYDVTPDINAWVTFNYGAAHTYAYSYSGIYKPANLTIQCSNAYLPASITSACAANNITSFQFGTWNQDFPDTLAVNDRNQTRYAVGADGKFELLGKTWSWSTYATHGETYTSDQLFNEPLNNLYNLAIDAVTAPNGAIVCRSALTSGNTGCIPLNVIGTGVANPQAIQAIEGTAWLDTWLRQEAASASLNGEPISDWAGPISLATGVEWREEAMHQSADPYSTGNGGNPLLSAAGNNWFTGNFHPSAGRYDVVEGFLETVAPVFDTQSLGKANLDLAARFTDYSTSGYVTTWKVGGTWDTPFEGLRFRATRSRDIRAPNLSELFTASTSLTTQIVDQLGPYSGQTFNIFQSTTGNVNLKPETADTISAGVVWQPRFLPGFSTSFDYYSIDLTQAIGTITSQQEMALCASGNQSMCSLITFNAAGQPVATKLVPINLASTTTNGFDIETSYRTSLSTFFSGLPGAIDIRSLITHVADFTTNSGLPGSIPTQSVGNYGGGNAIPAWRWQGTETYSNERWSLTATERYVSPGVINTAYIQCTTNCPAPTINNPTINNNHVDGAFLFDLGGTYNLKTAFGGAHSQLFFKIANVTNANPPTVPAGGGLAFLSRAYNPALSDVLGRVYRIGWRFSY